MSVSIESAPHRLRSEHLLIFTKNTLKFLEELCNEFDEKLNGLLRQRERQKINILDGCWKPKFENVARNLDWQINELPQRLRNRRLDLGDISPANTTNFVDALYANVQGIQVDFDDAHCPTWRNTIQGLYNVVAAVHTTLPRVPADMTKAPLLLIRPRALNMVEHHCMINGKEVSAALFDFAILMFHNANKLHTLGIGPYFYLPKIENANETKFWNDIFIWSQQKLDIPRGTIKACVLIENILAAYCMEDILYSIREHAIGLNCGVWDYNASIIAKFGTSQQTNTILHDRKLCSAHPVHMVAYIQLMIEICHRRSALATSGMVPEILPPGKGTCQKSMDIIDGVLKLRKIDIELGVDGYLCYDMRLVEHLNDLWKEMCGNAKNQLHRLPNVMHIEPIKLLEMPNGKITIEAIRHNVAVAVLFIYHWLSGSGLFFYRGCVEDSATAEISRSQLWQWIRFSVPVHEKTKSGLILTRKLVYDILDDVIIELERTLCRALSDRKRLTSSKYILLEIITSKVFIDSLSAFLNDNHKFRALHNKNEGLEGKL